MASPHNLTTEEILHQLQQLTQGLYYQSEADYPLEIIQFKDAQIKALTKEAILTLTGKMPGEPVEVIEPASFFRRVTPANPAEKQEASSATSSLALQLFLEQYLQEIKVYRIGRRTLLALLAGKTAAGNWIGIKTTIIET